MINLRNQFFQGKGVNITHQMRDFLFIFIFTSITFNVSRGNCAGLDSKEEVFLFWLFCPYHTCFTTVVNEKYLFEHLGWKKVQPNLPGLCLPFWDLWACLFWMTSFFVRTYHRPGWLSADLSLDAVDGINDSDWTPLISLIGMTQILHTAPNPPCGNFGFQCWYNLYFML